MKVFQCNIHFIYCVQNLAIVDIQSMPTDLIDDLKLLHPHSRIIYFHCDVTIKDELRTTFNSIVNIFQAIDILINAAGIFNDKDIELTFKVNVVGILVEQFHFLCFSNCFFNLFL